VPRRRYVIQKVARSKTTQRGRMSSLSRRGGEVMFKISMDVPLQKGDVVEVLEWEDRTYGRAVTLHKSWSRFAKKIKKVNY